MPVAADHGLDGAAARRDLEQGHALARAQLDGVYQEMPSQYRAPGCADGGPLDLRPDDARFP